MKIQYRAGLTKNHESGIGYKHHTQLHIRYSSYHFVLEALFFKAYEVYITTDILLEYKEMLSRNFNRLVAESFTGALLVASNVKKAEVYFDLDLIKTDADDNKFVNCAFAANADFLISNDKHFNILKEIEFPKINLLSLEEFAQVLTNR